MPRVRYRVPFTTLVFGMLLAWAFLTLIGFALPAIFDPHVIIASGAAGAIMAYLFQLIAARAPLTGAVSRFGVIRRGCFYGAAGYTFFLVLVMIAALTAMPKEEGLQLRGCGPALVSLAAFGGLGIAGGFMFLRFRRAEGDRQRTVQELEIARDLQQRLLPPPLLETERFTLTARNVPAAYVAGDFYDFVALSPDRMMIVLADVAGKGLAAGFLMASTKAILPVIAATTDSPDMILRRVNDTIVDSIRGGRDFVAILVAIYDAATGELSIANAGMPDPIVIGRNAISVSGPRYPAGIKHALAYERATEQLAPGDRVLFFSDGLPEATVRGEPLGYDRLATEAARATDLDSLIHALDALGGSHDDDWTAVMLTIPARPRPPQPRDASTSRT